MAEETQEPWRADVEEFAHKSGLVNMPVLIAIDPGASGAIGFYCNGAHTAVDIPTIKVSVSKRKTLSEEEQAKTGKKAKHWVGQTTRFDFGSIVRLFQTVRFLKTRITVILEEIPPSLGPGKHHGEIMLNRAWAIWPLYIHALGYPLVPLRPNDWKKVMGLTGKEKDSARHMAMGLFPQANLTLKKHVDRADALLMIAAYLKMNVK